MFSTGGVERARILPDGTGAGLLGGSISAIDEDVVVIPAASFDAINTASAFPVFAQVGPDLTRGPWTGWLFGPDTRQYVAATTMLPPGWGQEPVYANAVIGWANAAASTGNVRWRLDYDSLFISQSIAGDDTHNELTAVADGQWALVETVAATSMLLYPDHVSRVEVFRFADHGADTLANNAVMLYVKLQRARIPVTSGWTRS